HAVAVDVERETIPRRLARRRARGGGVDAERRRLRRAVLGVALPDVREGGVGQRAQRGRGREVRDEALAVRRAPRARAGVAARRAAAPEDAPGFAFPGYGRCVAGGGGGEGWRGGPVPWRGEGDVREGGRG